MQQQHPTSPSHIKSGNLAVRRPDPGQVVTGPAANTSHLQMGSDNHSVTGSQPGSHDQAWDY